MRVLILVVFIVLGIILVGGAVKVSGVPIFGHIDSALGTHWLMTTHYAVFSIIYRGGQEAGSRMRRLDEKIDDFRSKPLGIDHKNKYRQLDDAADK